MKKKDWLKLKPYVHFSPKLIAKDIPFIRRYVSSPKKVSEHRFYPFIKYTIKESKFRRGRNPKKDVRHTYRSVKKKERDVLFANHLDAQVYSYYSKLLTDKIEAYYKLNPEVGKSVTSYRRIPHETLRRNKSSIDFAFDLFKEVRSRDNNCVVLCFDVVGFFDNLDHLLLKKMWKALLDVHELPVDHYAVYKNITKFAFVEINSLFKEFNELGVQSMRQFKYRRLKCYCKNVSEFRTRVVENGLIKLKSKDNHKVNRGIPQGSPISATLSNVYMKNFDAEVSHLAKSHDEFYRRYCDDLVYVTTKNRSEIIKEIITTKLQNELKLEISIPKLQEFYFQQTKSGVKIECKVGGRSRSRANLAYLGFEYNGRNIFIKPSSVSRYYRGTKRLIRRKANYAKKDKFSLENFAPKEKWNDFIYRERVYKRKSHLGSVRKTVDGKVSWGNYLSFAYEASKVMNEPKIRKQVRNHWKVLEKEIVWLDNLYKLSKTPSKKNRSRNTRNR